MNELKPCRCGCNTLDIEYDKVGIVHGFLIGCVTFGCEQPPVIKMALSKKRAYQKTVNAWNRSVSGEE